VPMLGDARALLVWWVSEVRGDFEDDFELPRAPLFPSERGGPADAEAFRLALVAAARCHLQGPVRVMTPHVLRHACASGLYRDGVDLMAIQRLLGHRWLTTTMRYVHVAADTIEAEYARAAEQAADRFTTVVPAGR
jgi:integrase/recombinase XerD